MKIEGRLVLLFIMLPLAMTISSAQTERWIYLNNGQYSGPDFANSIVYGLDGYLYAAGSSKNATWDDDFTVISLDQNGSERWVYTYHTPGSTSDVATCITYGLDGNVYVAGHSHCVGIFDDLLIISFDQNGTERWIYRSGSSISTWDKVSSIIYGEDGNLYIVGESSVLGTWGDFSVLSLDTNGNEMWLYRYNGSGNHLDWAKAVVYGLDGRIYACGRCNNTGTSDDFIVLCLDQSGSEQWVYTYNGPANGIDRALSLVYGTDGNLYVAGYSDSTNPMQDCDVMVISLTANGSERWRYRYNGPADRSDCAADLVFGTNGDIYATGVTWTGTSYHDVIIVCLDQNGTEKWIYTYDGRPPRNNDFGDFMCYGQDNNIYVGGCSNQWLHNENSECLAISVDTNGIERWVYRYQGSEMDRDKFRSLSYGLDGHLYLAGFSSDSLTHQDITVISLDPITMIEEKNEDIKGNSNFATIFNGPLILPESKKCIIFDITGRVVLPYNIKPGIYFVEIDGVISHKVIKIK